MNLIRKMLPYTAIVVLLAALYTGYTFWSRADANHRLQKAADQRTAESAKKVSERFGRDEFKIVNFYAAPSLFTRGQPGKLCYSVSNAKEVALDPPVEKVWPALGRCFDVTQAKTTHYKLTATNAQGHTVSEEIDVPVR